MDPSSERLDSMIGQHWRESAFTYSEAITEGNRWVLRLPDSSEEELRIGFDQHNERCTARNLVHELGHVLGLPGLEGDHKRQGGLMYDFCHYLNQHFSALSLGWLRAKGVSQ